MGETSPVTTVIVHGAGSTGAAAAALLGPDDEAVYVEDRSGDVEHVIAALVDTLATQPACTHLVGISLGAHAVARWASGTAGSLPRLTCVLPAWVGAAGATAQATAAAGRAISVEGISAVLDRLASDGGNPDVVRLLQLAWADYSDADLSHSLARASRGRGPTPTELGEISVPITLAGWGGDAFHPASVVHEWSRHLPRAHVVMAARPDVSLLRRALATAPVGRH